MRSTANDAQFNDLEIASYMFATAMIGPTKGVLEQQAPRKLTRILRRQLISLCLGYLEREADAARRVQPRQYRRGAAGRYALAGIRL